MNSKSMKPKFTLVLVGLVLATMPALCRETQAPLPVALLEFDSPFKVMRHDVSDLVMANLSADPRVILVERSALNKVLKEQALGLSGNVVSENAAKVGQLTGAKVLVTGRVFKVGNKWAISTRIIGTETGRVFSESIEGSRTDLFNVTSNLSQKIAQTITMQSTNLAVDATLSHEDRITKMIGNIKGERRPAVLINIHDQAGSKGSRNLTVENELGRIFQKAGFTIVAETSDRRPDVLITGNAISGDGMRHGALYSSQARVEIEAKEKLEGKILLTDRQVNVAVDIERESARSLALQNATGALAERLLPVLAK